MPFIHGLLSSNEKYVQSTKRDEEIIHHLSLKGTRHCSYPKTDDETKYKRAKERMYQRDAYLKKKLVKIGLPIFKILEIIKMLKSMISKSAQPNNVLCSSVEASSVEPISSSDKTVEISTSNNCCTITQFLNNVETPEDQGMFFVQEEKAEITEEKVEVQEEKAEITEEKVEVQEKKAEITEEKVEITEEKVEITEEKVEITEEKAEIKEEKAEIKEEKAEILEEKVETSRKKSRKQKKKARKQKKAKMSSNKKAEIQMLELPSGNETPAEFAALARRNAETMRKNEELLGLDPVEIKTFELRDKIKELKAKRTKK